MSSKKMPQQTGERRVAFLSLAAHIGAFPAVISGITRLVHHGYQVDVILPHGADHIPMPHFPEGQVNIFFLPTKRKRGIVPGLFQVFARAVQLLRKRGRYVCFFGVDQKGLILAALAGKLLGTRVIYYSMELYMSEKVRGFHQWAYKILERKCNRHTWLTLMQDPERADCLVEDNRISQSQIMIVPNAPLGSAARKRGTYFNEKFGIADDRKIVLCAGSVVEWAMSLELTESALTWPDEWVLVLHGWVEGAGEDYLRQIKYLATDSHVILSLDVVPYEDVDRLYSSADIGVALYQNRGPNFYHIAGASGKLIRYLKCGLPVVTSDSPGLRRLTEQYRCGVCVGSGHEIKEAIAQLLADYDEFSANAIRCYTEEYDFAKHFDRVIAKIDESR